jgi:hypothetical protein
MHNSQSLNKTNELPLDHFDYCPLFQKEQWLKVGKKHSSRHADVDEVLVGRFHKIKMTLAAPGGQDFHWLHLSRLKLNKMIFSNCN